MAGYCNMEGQVHPPNAHFLKVRFEKNSLPKEQVARTEERLTTDKTIGARPFCFCLRSCFAVPVRLSDGVVKRGRTWPLD
jgi:hypothetical protein